MTDSSLEGGAKWYEVLNATHEGCVVPLNVILFRAREGSALYDSVSSTKMIGAINATRNMYVTPGKGGAARLAVSNWMTGLRVNETTGKGDYDIVIETLQNVMQ